jgi:p-cumate 2,3-dioxygenase alpha subunit
MDQHIATPLGVRLDQASGLFQVSRRVFTDQTFLELEHQKIFEKCWLYFGHDSELPEPGSFLTRTVAGRDFIFSRDSAGQVHVLYNLCTHRGGRVCREKSGKASVFQCFYHGWVFGSDGGLRLIPQEGAYPAGYRNERDRGLVSVPRLENYRGFWFINLDASAMSLSDYLAGAKEYLDDIVDQSEIGMTIVPGGQNFQVDANWKLWHENGMDPFHVHSVHATYFEYSADVLKAGKEKAQASGVSTEAFDTKASAEVMMKGRYAALMQTKTKLSFDLGNGHMAYNYPSTHGRPFAQWHPSWDARYKPELDQLYEKLVARVGPERARRIAHFDHHILIFPNLAIVDNHGIMIRTYFSKKPEEMLVQSWTIAPKEESAEIRKLRLYSYMDFLGPAGFGTPDDVEAIEAAQRGYKGAEDYDGWNDISAGLAPKDPESFIRNGDEGRMRVFWTKWQEYLSN